MSKPARVLLLLVSCPPCGVIYAYAAVASLTLFGRVFGMSADIADWIDSNLVGIAFLGMICGLISIIYVVPLLAHTDLPRSAYRLFLVTLTVSVLTGPLVPTAPFCALIAQIGVCIFEYQRARRPRRVGVCASCDYPLINLPTPICPECGTDSSLAQPG